MSIFYPGQTLLPSCNFLVTIGQEIFSFSKVSNLVSQVEYETVCEGGNNDFPLLFPKQKTNPDTLVLEKGVHERSWDIAFNSLVEGMWVEQVTIMLVKNGILLEKVFVINKGMIVKRSFSNLDAGKGDLLIETLVIAHTGLMEIPI